MRVQIDPSAYCESESQWNVVQPSYESKPIVERGATHTHAWGANVGSFVYKFSFPDGQWSSVRITARMSSEHPWYSSPRDHFSDVTLILNGSRYPSKRVLPDNGSGLTYTWDVEVGDLHVGENRLVFAVKATAGYRNGLCIYHRALVAGETDAAIIVVAEPASNP
jgi:hypothetical protein